MKHPPWPRRDEVESLATGHNRGPEIKMKRNVRTFFLHALFGLSVTQISEMTGRRRPHISRDIALVRDQFFTGELEIFPVSDGEKKQAEIRLNKKRAKERAQSKAAWARRNG